MLLKGLAAALAALALSLPVALAADPARVGPGQRVDLKVLLLSADGSEPGYGAWQAQLDREGVPYDTLVAATAPPLTAAQLYAGDHARYQAVILATGDLGHNVANPDGSTSYLSALSDTEWATLAQFERAFGIRRLSDFTAPGPAHGLTVSGGATQDGVPATLTAAGRAAFPYLKGPVTIADDDTTVAETFGYPATPVGGADWQTLLAAPNGSAFLGIYTHPDDGREEMVMTVASNQFQNHNQLLRHGMLNWVTRGVFLGYERNYLELQVDDLFLGDDAWDPVTNTTSYDPALASRMTPRDVDRAIAWSRARGLRLDMVFNGGGSALHVAQTGGADALAAHFSNPAVRDAFGYINHTYEHPNLDCSTASFITRQITRNVDWARARGLTLADPAELVTGEHSGLANTRPGNPGTIDPPSIDDAVAGTGGAIPPGTYEYAVTARTPAGETVASSVSDSVVLAAAGSARVTFKAVCHAVGYDVYRRPVGGAYERVGTLARSANAPTDDGVNPIVLSVTDAAVSGTPAAPPTANGAALSPYAENPAFLAGVTAAGTHTLATDASKGYPPFAQGMRAVPRYPSNVYYNVSRQGQQLDEYNWIYVAPEAGGGCVPIDGVTTCRTAPATWDEYVTLETRVMFRHLTGNDPRPHFFHQSNLADYNPALPDVHADQGGILYPVMDALVGRYEAAFDRAAAPLVQLTHTQIADALTRQDAWARDRAGVSAWVQDGRVYVHNAGAAPVTVPLTGTTAGEPYGMQRSGWVTVPAGTTAEYAPADPAAAGPPAVTGTARVGETLESTVGTWTGTAPIATARRWQRCATRCVTIAGATGATYRLTDADRGHRLRVAALAGNWISSVSQAFSALTDVVAARSETAREGGDPTPGSGGRTSPAGRSAPLRLTRVKMSPRRFAVSSRRPRRGTRLDGTRISWRLNRAATVRLTFQRRTRRGWVRIGQITRAARAGTGVVRFRGRFGARLLRPQRYRLVISAAGGGERTAPRRIAFRVVKR